MSMILAGSEMIGRLVVKVKVRLCHLMTKDGE